MKLYYNPISSYSQKTLMGFYEKNVPFEASIVNLGDPAARAEYEKVYPMGKVPFLWIEEKQWAVPESTTILEYLDQNYPDNPPRLLPEDPQVARQVRMWDRSADFNLNEPMQKIFFDGRRPADKRDPFGVESARRLLDRMYGALDGWLAGKTWVMGETFSLADCSMAPPLAYLRMVHPFTAHKNITSYMGRLVERPSFARVLGEAAPILKSLGVG